MLSPRIVIRTAILFGLAAIVNGTPVLADSNNLPTRVPGLGTFSGDLSARQFRGNGIYFSSGNADRCFCPQEAEAPDQSRPGARIINMENAENAMDNDGDGRETARSDTRILNMEDAQDAMDCDNPGNVCVIRP